MLSSIQRSSPPRARSSTGPPIVPSAGAVAVGVLDLGEDVGVGLLLDVREEVLGRGVREIDPAVGAADEDAVADRPDDGVQLRRSGVLRLGETAEVGLRLHPFADVAGDGDDPPGLAGRRHVLEQHLDGNRPAVAVAVGEGRGAGVERAVDERLDEAAQPDRVELVDDGRGLGADAGRPPCSRAGPSRPG